MGPWFFFFFLCALGLLLRPSNFSLWTLRSEPQFVASFEDIGELKVNAPVKLAGVKLGRVKSIRLNREQRKAEVIFSIDAEHIGWLAPSTRVRIQAPLFFGESSITLMPPLDYQGPPIKDGHRFINTESPLSLQDWMETLSQKASIFLGSCFNNPDPNQSA